MWLGPSDSHCNQAMDILNGFFHEAKGDPSIFKNEAKLDGASKVPSKAQFRRQKAC
jgi:hypothetical protein